MSHIPSDKLEEQIDEMIRSDEDYIPNADGIDDKIHIVINYFHHGVWLCEHHGLCDINKYDKLQRLR